jgi:TolA-binding protein
MFKRFSLRLAFTTCVLLAAMGPSLAQEDPTESENVLRITKLEATIRELSGQIEELQFNNKKLEDQLKALQQSTGNAPSQSQAKPTVNPPASGPLDLMSESKVATATAPAGTMAAQAAAAKNPPPAETPLPKDAKSDLAAARAQFRGGDFAGASNALQQFLRNWPKDPSVTDAIILLGDAEYRQKRYPEAAQQYLKIAQASPVNPSAPLAFAKLGDALVSMGQKPQACATFTEFGRRFADADQALKSRVEKAKSGAGC